jgi:hypothetical protein
MIGKNLLCSSAPLLPQFPISNLLVLFPERDYQVTPKEG